MKRVLLLRPDQAGDAIKTIPSLRALARHYSKNFDIFVLCSKINVSLLSLEKVKAVLEPPAGVDVLINLQADPFSKTASLIGSIDAKEKWSVAISNLQGVQPIEREKFEGLSEVHRIALIVEEALGISLRDKLEKENAKPLLSEEEEKEIAILRQQKKGLWLGLAPFSSISGRCFSPLSARMLISQVLKSSLVTRLYVVGLPHELKTLGKIDSTRVKLHSAKEFRSLGIILSCLDGCIGVDTGILHFAKELEVPILMFGRGVDVKRWYSPVRKIDRVVARGLVTPFATVPERAIYFQIWFNSLRRCTQAVHRKRSDT